MTQKLVNKSVMDVEQPKDEYEDEICADDSTRRWNYSMGTDLSQTFGTPDNDGW